jgi:glyoxylase-like metal-dependent hydrolase (beta-lactamase superfamily II)
VTVVQPTDKAQFRAWASGGIPEPSSTGMGSWAIPVPIAGSRLRYVLTHVLAGDDGLIVIDPGWPSSSAWAALENGLAAIGQRPQDVVAILATHGHPDHHGLSERLRAASSAWVGMHEADGPRLAQADQDELARAELSRAMGVARESASSNPRSADQRAAPDRPLADGELLRQGGRQLRVIATPGHTAGHMCFVDEDQRVLYAGDHLLPSITPNVSVNSRQNDDPVADYLRSLDRTAHLDVDHVACAHQYHFQGASERSQALRGHHQDRLDLLLELITRTPGRTCYQLTSLLPWASAFNEMSRRVRLLAARETMAHLIHLEYRGRIVRTSSDADGDHWEGA